MNVVRLAHLQRKQILLARISRQRAELAAHLGMLQGPLRTLTLVRQAGEAIKRHAALIMVSAAFGIFILSRGGVIRRIGGALALVKASTRWWFIARIAWRVATHFIARRSELQSSNGIKQPY